ncbi:Na+/H+ antiporter NhaC family protein [Thermococcus argininiproducens]|uniref:Na+/H+ antiporter NhaC family protein n=1 Tax=Thermococcus argininiproducens TaxID=2866384 RepID=A0A9E7MA41_9EURY|nr:Na+/H+ antiporter NhaC family protein [Thermococcus argininiproducens]USG99855.1 Na+/H+ antiporter NhaC family protein [Thermococcus argininiproducens]
MFEGGYGALSLLPVVIALALAFFTKDAIFSLFMGVLVGVVMLGFEPTWLGPARGLSLLFQEALGNASFIWVASIEVFIGILIAFFLKAGVTSEFARVVSTKIKTRRQAQVMGWLLGIFIFFSDYFSPLFTGTVMRPITDKVKVSREKLAYILDSGSAPVIVLVPFTGWAVYISGLLAKQGGPITTSEEAIQAFVHSIPYNFYAIVTVIMVGLIASGIIPDFGPMKKAEERAMKTGKVLRDGAIPLVGQELERIKPKEGKKANIFLHLVIPVMIVIGIGLGSFIVLKSAKTLEAFITAVLYLIVVLYAQGFFDNIRDLVSTAIDGIKGVLPAILILALAYSINTVTKSLGAQDYIISVTQSWMTPSLLVLLTFIVAALISFFTGTSWGTYAIMIPFVIPLAYNLTNNTLGPLVYATIAAVAGGGVFGDHCSPVSDTTVLSSFGAACDHMDHVTTQLPYAVTAATVAAVLYIIVGVFIV